MIDFDTIEKQLTVLAHDADLHDDECEDAEIDICGYRWHLTAWLMTVLGLGLADLGHIAEEWVKLQEEMNARIVNDDAILDAKELQK